MAQKCVHKGCGNQFTDPDEPCVYHPGPPEFHEGQKGWKCCKPRVLTFEEFLAIPPCTTGTHSAVDDTPAPEPKKQADLAPAPVPVPVDAPKPISVAHDHHPDTLAAAGAHTPTPRGTPAPPPEDESDDPDTEVPVDATCRRRACGAKYTKGQARDGEKCVHHPGQPVFHEGSKGWSCCKRRVLEFDEFMKIAGCAVKERHLFVGRKGTGEEKVDAVRYDFYQTPSTVNASFFLKKIDKTKASVVFSSPTTIDFDLPTSDNKRFRDTYELFGPIDTEKSTYAILGTKMEMTLVKADGSSWPVLRATDPRTGEIIQAGGPKRA